MTTTPGRLIANATEALVANMEPGDYGKRGDDWFCYPPREGAGPVNISTWSVVEHEDGTITVSPSINVMKPNGWHGYLERGVWREV